MMGSPRLQVSTNEHDGFHVQPSRATASSNAERAGTYNSSGTPRRLVRPHPRQQLTPFGRLAVAIRGHQRRASASRRRYRQCLYHPRPDAAPVDDRPLVDLRTPQPADLPAGAHAVLEGIGRERNADAAAVRASVQRMILILFVAVPMLPAVSRQARESLA